MEVKKDNSLYTFDLNLTDESGKTHTKQHIGSVNILDSYKKSPYEGFFEKMDISRANAIGHEDKGQIILITGNYLGVYYRQMYMRFKPPLDYTPVGSYRVGEDIDVAHIFRETTLNAHSIKITSGTLTIVPVPTQKRFNAYVDVTTEDGENIKGSFINGQSTIGHY